MHVLCSVFPLFWKCYLASKKSFVKRTGRVRGQALIIVFHTPNTNSQNKFLGRFQNISNSFLYFQNIRIHSIKGRIRIFPNAHYAHYIQEFQAHTKINAEIYAYCQVLCRLRVLVITEICAHKNKQRAMGNPVFLMFWGSALLSCQDSKKKKHRDDEKKKNTNGFVYSSDRCRYSKM